MESKLRIASKIFGCLDDTEAAVHDCLLYLKELQDLPAVQALFIVWRERGLTSRLRARFNQTKRNAMVGSIQTINGLLLSLTVKFAKIKMSYLSWPTINIGNRIYHPILDNKEIMKELETKQYTMQVPWLHYYSFIPNNLHRLYTHLEQIINQCGAVILLSFVLQKN